jgi:hypothetical protein
MTEVDATELQQAVEAMHNCVATLAYTVPVKEEFDSGVIWIGLVYVFDLKGHPNAARAYAWSSPIEGSDKQRFFAVLKLPPVESPIDAVRAAIVGKNRNTGEKS